MSGDMFDNYSSFLFNAGIDSFDLRFKRRFNAEKIVYLDKQPS
jgi:hypothetical protein